MPSSNKHIFAHYAFRLYTASLAYVTRMTKQMVTEYTCDRCSGTQREGDFKRNGGATITIVELRDKRKRSSADLCGDCVSLVTVDLVMSKDKDVADRPHHMSDVV